MSSETALTAENTTVILHIEQKTSEEVWTGLDRTAPESHRKEDYMELITERLVLIRTFLKKE